MLGPTQLVNVSTQETIDFQSRKAMCLLALLVMTPDRTMSREKLASFLWDPAPEEQARGSLRQCLKRMRLALGDEADRILEIGRSDVRLIAGNFESDLWLLTDIVKSGTSDKSAVLEAVNLWRGDILANGVPKAPIFEASLQVERSRLKTMLTSWLADWLQAHFAEFDQESRKIAQELLRIEPSHELAHQHLIYHFAVNGNQAAAIRQFNELESALAEELDSVPSDESVDLLVKVKSGELAGSHERQVQTGPVPSTNRHRKLGIPRIAVRPPLGRVLDEDLNYLADGFADLLVSCLSKFKCWVVLVWPSKGFPAQGRIDYQALAQSTGADYVVDAVLDWRQSPGRLHVSLIDCEAEENVWTETLTAEPHELHALSNSVAGKISSRLASQINHIASLRFERSVAGNASAYDSWLRGHQLTRLWDKSADRQALALFEEAIAQDPGLSCAYASMAAVYNTRIMVRPGESDDHADLEHALSLCQKALLLDPHDSRNHVNMGWSRLLTHASERAATHFKLAVDLNPYDTETLMAGAQAMAFLGDLDLANKWSVLGLELNPLHPDYYFGYLASIKYLSGSYDEAIGFVKQCPDAFPETRVWAAVSYACLGQHGMARDAFGKFLSDVGRRWEGAGLPTEDAILGWLSRAIPLTWEEGQSKFNSDLAVARGNAPPERISGTS